MTGLLWWPLKVCLGAALGCRERRGLPAGRRHGTTTRATGAVMPEDPNDANETRQV